MSDGELNLLRDLDYSVVQQCMHCGMCLPSCPTYATTLRERSSPRGRIAMMRAIADGRRELSRSFAEEMYFCLGCLACQTACPAGVNYSELFENARAEVERQGLLDTPKRKRIRSWTLRWLFVERTRLHLLGRLLRLYQRSGLERLVRASGLLRLLPASLRELEPLTPRISRRFTAPLHARSVDPPSPRYRVALLSGCVQDIAFADTNADTMYALRQNGCAVRLPEDQACCGSLHAHNGDGEMARDLARRNIDAFAPDTVDAIIVNAGGCGSHMKHYDHLLADDPKYAARARTWSEKVKDIHEFLAEINFRAPKAGCGFDQVTYHESCHLKHGQQVSEAPRQILRAIPGLDLVELAEADWCCGSAGIYNITQPETSMRLLDRKMGHVRNTGVRVVATGNPGCVIQLQHGGQREEMDVDVVHPISLLAAAYRGEGETL